jgi:PPE-repeat protein
MDNYISPTGVTGQATKTKKVEEYLALIPTQVAPSSNYNTLAELPDLTVTQIKAGVRASVVNDSNPLNNVIYMGVVPDANGFATKWVKHLSMEDVPQVYTSGATVTVANGVRRLYVNPPSLITSLTITFPSAPSDNDRLRMFFGGAVGAGSVVITALSLAGGGVPIIATNPVSILGGQSFEYVYNKLFTTPSLAAGWRRLI